MSELNRVFIHYWVREISDRILQQEIDYCIKQITSNGPMFELVIFSILLNEKLRRVENEIAILDAIT